MDAPSLDRTPGRGRWRQRLRFGVLCLALGLLSTLLMAWVVPPLVLRFGVVTHRNSWTSWGHVSTSGEWRVRSSRIWLSHWVQVTPVGRTNGGSETTSGRMLPRWVQVPPADGRFARVDTAATGWPLRAMTSESWMERDTRSGPGREILRNNVLLGTVARGRIFLPLGVLWGELLGDVAIHGAAWGVLLIAPPLTRRAIRRGHGRCASCGYNICGLAGAPCPECGAAVPSPARATST